LSSSTVDVHELIAWGLDEYPCRTTAIGSKREEFAKHIEQARQQLARRTPYVTCSALLAEETENVRDLFATAMQRSDLKKEYERLDWTLGIVDLRHLLAFQRRLVFSHRSHHSHTPKQNDWAALISFAMGEPRATKCSLLRQGNATGDLDVSLYSSNPDLKVRLNQQAGTDDTSLLSLYGGSPFFEVAELRGRWFLRDGYHRAYRLLQASVNQIPAVVIRARTLEELGATDAWFFGEDQLFSDLPPQVIDFLDESMVLHYQRAALRKVIRIRIEESLQPFDEIEEIQGEDQ
jgi:hypothetical protein